MRSPNILVILMIVIGFASCQKPDNHNGNGNNGYDVPVTTYAVGDYFHNDTLSGVVFKVTAGGTQGMMVSLDETQCQWCLESYIIEETGATNAIEGWNNTNIVMSNYDLINFPAIAWSMEKNTWFEHGHIAARHWYVPSSDELRTLLLNMNDVNTALQRLGKPTMEDKTYWSSTELGTRIATALYLQNDVVANADSEKTNRYYVRAVCNF